MNDTTIGAGRAQAEPDPDTLWPTIPLRRTLRRSRPSRSRRGASRRRPTTCCAAARLWPDARRSPPCPRRPAGTRPHPGPTPSCWTSGPRTCCTLGVRRGDAVAASPQRRRADHGAAVAVAGAAAPINAGLSAEHIVELLTRSGRGCSCAPDRGSTPAVEPRVDGRRRRRHRSPVALGPAGPEPVGTRCDPGRLPRRSGSGTAGGGVHGRAAASRRHRRALPHRRNHGKRPSWRRTPTRTRWSTRVPRRDPDPRRRLGRLRRIALFHVNALVVTLLARSSAVSRRCGRVRGLPRSCALPRFWRIVEHYRVAAMSAVPTTMQLARCPVDADISSLRVAMVGASALLPGVRATSRPRPACRCSRGTASPRGPVRAFAASWAITARGGRSADAVPADEGDRGARRRHLGRPAGGRDRRPRHPRPTVFPGYVVGRVADVIGARRPRKLRDGWLETGDLGSVDDDGFAPSSAGPGPHHPRRPQHRSGGDRRRPPVAPGGDWRECGRGGRTRIPGRCPWRR